ncbi:hypothetical protein RB195_007507 [Necator americanus]|uniref:SCP-like protein n=1 Tax=Necator americanus TaxID=51031 RepID=A0ABR1C0B4_NECAM
MFPILPVILALYNTVPLAVTGRIKECDESAIAGDEYRTLFLQAHNNYRLALANGSSRGARKTKLPGSKSLFKFNYNCQLELLASAVALDCQYGPSLNLNDIGYSQNFRRHEGVTHSILDSVNNLEDHFNNALYNWWYTVETEILGPIGSKVIYKEDGMEEFANAAIREKKSKYKLCWRTRQPEDWAAYLAANREAKKAVSKANSDRYKAVYDMLDTTEGERAVYRLVRVRHRSTLDMEHTKIVKGADGAVLRRSGQILERWREYYNHLCNKEFCHPAIPGVPSVEGPVLPITAVEVSAALTIMKSNKTTGPDNIPADVWKLLGDEGPRGSQLYLTRSL